MNRKVALVAFNGDPVCFIHVLLNALDFKTQGFEVRVVLEGSAAGLVRELNEPGKPLSELYQKVKQAGLIQCVCRACASKMGSLASAEEQGLPVCGDMSGHPGLAGYVADGYQVITF